MNGNNIVAVAIANEIRDRIMAQQEGFLVYSDFSAGVGQGLEVSMEIIDDFIDEVSGSGS